MSESDFFSKLPIFEQNYIILIFYNLTNTQIFLQKPNIIITKEMQKVAKLYLTTQKPLSKIFKFKYFWSERFYTNSKTLDPRPETEHIIEYALKLYDSFDNFNILDLGCGTGCIGISILKNFPNAKATLLDIKNSALKIARYNAKKLNVINRINFVNNDWLKNFDEKYDLLVSNPPYLTKEQINSNKNILKYDPYIALFDATGLTKYEEIFYKRYNFKYILLEISSILKYRIHNLFKFEGQIINDYLYFWKNGL